jgi:hypothetical protein
MIVDHPKPQILQGIFLENLARVIPPAFTILDELFG